MSILAVAMVAVLVNLSAGNRGEGARAPRGAIAGTDTAATRMDPAGSEGRAPLEPGRDSTSEYLCVAGAAENELGDVVGDALIELLESPDVSGRGASEARVIGAALSGERGRFVVRVPTQGIARRVITLRASCAEHMPAAVDLDVEDVEAGQDVKIALRRRVREVVLRGRVVSNETGLAVPGALVLAFSDIGPGGRPSVYYSSTDAGGVFELNLRTFRLLNAWVYAHEYLAERVDEGSARTAADVFALRRNDVPIHGVVFRSRDTRGAPVHLTACLLAGPHTDEALMATIERSENGERWGHLDNVWDHLIELISGECRSSGDKATAARYGLGTGDAAVGCLPVGDYRFLIVGEGGLSAVEEFAIGAEDPVWIERNVVLRRGLALEGMIEASGTPIPPGSTASLLEAESFAGTVASDGRFEIRDVPPGSWTLVVRRPGHLSECASVNVDNSTGTRRVNVRITVRNEGQAVIRARTARGQPIEGAIVQKVGLRLATTNEQGIARIGGLPPLGEPVALEVYRDDRLGEAKAIVVHAYAGALPEEVWVTFED